jgi:uncharacterized protein YcfJ
VGIPVGCKVGDELGNFEGATVGKEEGALVGCWVGEGVGHLEMTRDNVYPKIITYR